MVGVVRGVPLRIVWLAVLLLCCAMAGTAPAQAPVTDVGVKDWPYPANLQGPATGSKPESKLWFNDGRWWASMLTPAGQHTIHQLSGGAWIDTGTALDARFNSRDDVLWDAASGKLYVAAHRFTLESSQDGIGTDGQLYRYSYDSATTTYTLDAGFPAPVGSPVTETLVIDKDSRGRLWTTWGSDGWIYVNHTDGTDTNWGRPYVLPRSGLGYMDDIPTLVAFDGGWVGVLWSNQGFAQLRFMVHQDTADDETWGDPEVVPVGFGADDHLNLKVASTGEVFGAIKNEESGTNGNAPLTYLIKRSTTGQWTTVPFGEWPLHTRPIVLLDEAAREAHMVATCPQLPATNGQAGGDICEKVTSMDDPSFDPRERGTTLISDSASAKLNNVTSTKQGLSAQTGMVVMATNDATNTLWHAELPLTVPLPDPRADFTATPATGAIPLDVQFRDVSGGAPKSWSWNFGDGTTSGARNPLHRYAEPGGYTVTLKITDDLARTSTAVRTDVIVAARPKPPPPPAAPPPTPPPALALALATDPQLRSVAVSAVDTTVPYGAAATLTAQVVGDRLGRVALALQGVRFPFDRPFADLAPVAAVYGAGTHTFRIANVSTKTVVQVVADGTVRSELVTVRSSVRAQITSLRRQGKRVVVRGIVRPATRKGVVVVERRLPTGAFAVTRRTTLLKDGRFAIRVTASAGQRLRAVGYPRDDDAHAPGTSTERRVPAR